jgi:hypothetical protein
LRGSWSRGLIKRGQLDRKAIAQVVDYAACIADLPTDELRAKLQPYLASKRLDLDALLAQRGATDSLEPQHRQVLLVVVGTGGAPGLERVVRFLSASHGLPISVILLDVFVRDGGELFLAREIAEEDAPPSMSGATGTRVSVDSVLSLAARHGTSDQLRRAIGVASRLGLHVRPYKKSVMFTPASNGTRMLFTLWAEPEKGGLKAYIGVEPFTEFYDLSRSVVAEKLGAQGWRTLNNREFEQFPRGLESLDIPRPGGE